MSIDILSPGFYPRRFRLIASGTAITGTSYVSVANAGGAPVAVDIVTRGGTALEVRAKLWASVTLATGLSRINVTGGAINENPDGVGMSILGTSRGDLSGYVVLPVTAEPVTYTCTLQAAAGAIGVVTPLAGTFIVAEERLS